MKLRIEDAPDSAAETARYSDDPARARSHEPTRVATSRRFA
jgi:hypothetical protein